jgi:23S rRNA (cytidine2498-2'-O)-methyltransferase
MGANHLFTCEPGWETPLGDELGRILPGAQALLAATGWLIGDAEPAPAAVPCLALVRQSLPHAEELTAPSIAAWARQWSDWVIARLAQHEGPWRGHVFANLGTSAEVGHRRALLVAEQFADELRRRRRTLLRRRITADARPFADDEAFVQLGLVTRTRGYASCLLPQERRQWRHAISRFPGGQVEVPSDRLAPSRAFQKLAECELRLGREIGAGETCVDLGASPGSWSYWALARGASVVAVDRSPLREDLMRHPRLTFVQGDAFRYRPSAAVDWLLCDVIAFPERTLELMCAWLAARWCRNFCITVKFRGRDDYAVLERFKAELARLTPHFCLRRLSANKNEVMACGRLASPAA